MSLALALTLFAQVGPGGALPQAPLQIPKPRKVSPVPAKPAEPVQPEPSRLQQCLDLAMARPSDGLEVARGWLAAAKSGQERAEANQCQAMAYTRIDGWAEAAALFMLAREDTPANESAERARLAALAGNSRLAAGDPAAALDALDLARRDARGGNAAQLQGEIEVDRARALVALGRLTEAAAALTDARDYVPANAQAWLLSATLSRRQGNLAEAQGQIERAVQLMPVDPEIGLEAGVIAVLAGHDEAARKSWLSVIRAAPGSPAAKTAQGYLDQLGPPAASPPR